MRSALASQFWNQELESSRAPDAVVRYLAHDPPPLTSLLCSGLSRPQQLLILQRLLPVPGTPSYAVDDDGGGGLVLDRILGCLGKQEWWTTLTGRLRVQRLVSSRLGWGQRRGRGAAAEAEVQTNGDVHPAGTAWQGDSFALGRQFLRDVGTSLADPDLYGLVWNSRARLGSRTWVDAVGELQAVPVPGIGFGKERGRREGHRPTPALGNLPLRGRVTVRHKTQQHVVVGDASLNSRCVDGHGCWWTSPHTLSLDFSSLRPWHGLRYRAGLHHVASEAHLDTPPPANSSPSASSRPSDALLPQGALPGTRAQAGASLEGQLVLWKDRCENRRRAAEEQREKWRAEGQPWLRRTIRDRCYNLLASRPRLTLFGLVGGITCLSLKTNWKDDLDQNKSVDGSSFSSPRLPRISAHIFALLGATAQLGLFERPLLDHTLVSGHLHLSSEASPLSLAHPSSPHALSRTGHSLPAHRCSPSVAVTLQQQVFGPIRARYDGRFGLRWAEGKVQTEPLETVLSLDCSFEQLLGAARLVVWYSPTRKEGMAEIRLLER